MRSAQTLTRGGFKEYVGVEGAWVVGCCCFCCVESEGEDVLAFFAR